MEANFQPDRRPIRPSPDGEIIAMMPRPTAFPPVPNFGAAMTAMAAVRMTDVNPGNMTAIAAGVPSMPFVPPAMMGNVRSAMPIPPGRPSVTMMMQMMPTFNADVGQVMRSFMMRPRTADGVGPGVMTRGAGMMAPGIMAFIPGR